MRRIILSTYLITLVSFSIAQENNRGLSISLKSGITFANMYGSDAESETILNGEHAENFYANHPASNIFKTGINFGLLLDYRFSEYISLGLGTSYIQKGAKINANKHWSSDLQGYEDVNGKVFWNQNFRTFEMPLTIYIPLKKNDIYFQIGLFRASLINSEEKGNVSFSAKEYEYVNDRYANEKEMGYFFRSGYMYSLPSYNGSVFAELSWSRSVLNSIGSDLIPNPQYYYNQTLSINIGYRYSFNYKKS